MMPMMIASLVDDCGGTMYLVLDSPIANLK